MPGPVVVDTTTFFRCQALGIKSPAEIGRVVGD
jgi:hypothetical protein